MVIIMENNQKKCKFCDKEIVADRIIDGLDKKDWYAFVPKDPEIFGHIILTTINFQPNCSRGEDSNIPKCPQEISEIYGNNEEIFMKMTKGLIECSNKLKKIKPIEKVYILVAGETDGYHIHYHLIPRYEFRSYDERKQLAKKINLTIDDPKWVEFYNWPTKDFKYRQDFRYLGEVEQKYNDCKNNEYYPIEPSKEIIEKIVTRINELTK